MINLSKFFQCEVEHAPVKHNHAEARCYEHNSILPCQQCAVDRARGYEVKVLAGRCANGSELDSGTRWHAVKFGTWTALCGAKPGRRSAGWSSWYVKDQTVTCPRCIKKIAALPKMTPQQVSTARAAAGLQDAGEMQRTMNEAREAIAEMTANDPICPCCNIPMSFVDFTLYFCRNCSIYMSLDGKNTWRNIDTDFSAANDEALSAAADQYEDWLHWRWTRGDLGL